MNDIGLDIDLDEIVRAQEEEEEKGSSQLVEMKPKLNQFKQQRSQHKKDIDMFESEIQENSFR